MDIFTYFNHDSVQQPAPKKSKTRQFFSLKAEYRLLQPLLAFMVTTCLALPGSSQVKYDAPPACINCVAQDVKILDVYLQEYNPVVDGCKNAGDSVYPRNIVVSYDVTAAERYGLLFLAILYRNDIAVDTLYNCNDGIIVQGPDQMVIPIGDDVPGIKVGIDKLELKEVFIAWDNNKMDYNSGTYLVCDSYDPATGIIDCNKMGGNGPNPHCKYYPIALNVRTPAKPEITVDYALSKDSLRCHGDADGSIYIDVDPETQLYYYPTTYNWTKDGVYYPESTQDITGLSGSHLNGGSLYQVIVTVDVCSDTASVRIYEPPAFSALTSSSPVRCYNEDDGRAWIYNASGGTPFQDLTKDKYLFIWDPPVANTSGNRTSDTAFDLTAGIYAVVLEDSLECQSDSFYIEVIQPDTLALTFNVVNDCLKNGGGSATAIPSGGNGGYTHHWETNSTSATISGKHADYYTDTVRDVKGCKVVDSAHIQEPPQVLSATKDSVNISCKGGSNGVASIDVSGGVEPYTYAWSTDPVQTDSFIEDVPAGTYSVTVTDALNCTLSKQFKLTEPATALTALVDSSKAKLKCPGDSSGLLVASGTGGTPYKVGAPYRYSWNYKSITTDSAKNLPAGTYTVTVTDTLGCSVSKTVRVTQPPAFSVAFTVTKVNCFGDSTGGAVAKATGGTGPLKYSWNTNPAQNSDTAKNLPVGVYTVTVTDSVGCTYKDSVRVTKISELKADTSKVNVKCFGDSTGSATVVVSGGTPKASGYLYSWNTTPVQTTATATKLAAGKYTVTITDSLGCNISVSITVTEPALLKAPITSSNICSETLKGSATVNPTGGTSPYTYSWSTSPAQTSATISNLNEGTYRVTVTDKNNCKASDSVTILKPASFLSFISKSTNVNCYGDATGSAEVTVSGGITPYQYSWTTNPVQTTASITGLKAGTYTVTITDSFRCTLTKTFTITQPAAPLTLSAKVDQPIICIDETTTIKVKPSGGTAPYSIQLNTGGFEKGVESYKNLGPGTYIITVKDSLNCSKAISVTITDKGCYNFCTYTMSYYGTDNNVMANFDQGSGCESATTRGTIQAALDEWASRGAELKVGNINVSKLGSPVDAILKYLPCGGPSLQYTGSTLDAQTPNNTLLSQTLTLGLNLGLNAKLDSFVLKNDHIITQRYTGECADGSALPGNCKNIKFDEQFKGKTVGEIFAAASEALVSGTPEERSSLANMVRTINEAFDKCALAVLICPSPNLNVTEYEELGTKGIVVKSYPNPFTDHVYIQFVSPINGEAVFEVFDFSGHKLQELRKPGVKAYQDNLIKYMVPKLNYRQILYRISIGQYRAKGILLSPGK